MSIVWSSLHIQYDFWGMSTIFMFGLILGIARLKTDSLWSPLLMHSLWNLAATIELIWTVGTI
jgi:membrane protease YdiL (CAAX protease family)